MLARRLALAVGNFSRKFSSVGGKTKGLLGLRSAGFPVPPFSFYDKKEILALDDQDKAKAFLKKCFSESFSAKYYAIRSSGSDEDSDTKSNAGRYHTSLGVTREDIIKEAKVVANSFDEGTVIVQKFIDGIKDVKSGVMFTDAGKKILVINAIAGLCDPVVKGESCDSYYVLPESAETIKSSIKKDKVSKYFDSTDGKFIEKNVDPEGTGTLSKDEIKLLLDAAVKIQKTFGKPQDVEWTISNGKLYMLQSRPITTEIVKNAVYYEGANIQESFPGVVSPLTFSTMQYAYQRIYTNAFGKLGINTKTPKMKSVFSNLLHLTYGRMFYNMNNWYLMRKLLPYHNDLAHKDNFENMITNHLKHYEYRTDIDVETISRLKYYAYGIWNYVLLQSRINSLLTDGNTEIQFFNSAMHKGLKTNPHSKEVKAVWEIIKSYDKIFMEKWYLIGMNDFMMSHYYNYLYKKFSSIELKELIQLESVSTKQVNDVLLLAKELNSNPVLWNTVVDADKEKFHALLDKYPVCKASYDEYFEKYSGRFGNELKFETIDIYENFSEFCNLLKLYIDTPRPSHPMTTPQVKHKGKYSLKDQFYVHQFKKHAINRENLRLLRSNFFGVMRKLFLILGDRYAKRGIITSPRDIFYLEYNEIDPENIWDEDRKKNISQRKLEYKTFTEVDPKNYYISINGSDPALSTPPEVNLGERVRFLRGEGCSLGTVTGRVKLFTSPEMPLTPFDILVAKNTDPGWTTLIGACKGMIIESGGILSHAAIVSRELQKPTVIGVPNIMNILQDDMTVTLNGSTGTITIN
ncbi:MAG: hypothetical protein Harvfovirus13_16 [Harvfovirus sp.]|uniref:Phosphoenolpyruvate synthase n=1 Tax=Harvfovirus sp. TaxID=2487768 RepID=A0A3G5A1K3_9VIRU|nr:MAG: hypothetical protein Harvfovirus13_16 [Harvfovirus sp.]